MQRLRGGDPAAFERLVRTHQHRVLSVAYRMLGNVAEAEDAAQDVFLRVLGALGQFRGDAKLSTWLYAVTSRVCLTRLAAGSRRLAPGRDDEETLARLPAPGDDPGREAEHRQLQAALTRAIDELPEERRLVVVLRDVEGLSYEDIAAALGVELGTVRSRLHRARMELKDKLEKFLP